MRGCWHGVQPEREIDDFFDIKAADSAGHYSKLRGAPPSVCSPSSGRRANDLGGAVAHLMGLPDGETVFTAAWGGQTSTMVPVFAQRMLMRQFFHRIKIRERTGTSLLVSSAIARTWSWGRSRPPPRENSFVSANRALGVHVRIRDP